MSGATGVFDNHWNITKISAMPHRWLDADFHGDADDGNGINAAIAQRDVKGRAFERGHGDLVEDGFARQRIHLRNQVESPARPARTKA